MLLHGRANVVTRASVCPSGRPAVKPHRARSELMPNLEDNTCPPYLETLFSKFYLFIYLLHFFFFFVNMGPYGNKISSDISSESMHQFDSQKVMHTPMESLYQSYSKNCEPFFLLLLFFFFVFVNMGPYSFMYRSRIKRTQHLVPSDQAICTRQNPYCDKTYKIFLFVKSHPVIYVKEVRLCV